VAHPEDHTAQQPTETLKVGPARPSLVQKIPARWRQRTGALAAFTLGLAGGGGAVLWWQEQPAPRDRPPHEHAVELVLIEAVQPRADPGARRSEAGPLQVYGAVLLSGTVTSTVLGINNRSHSLGVRAPALPVTVSPTARFQSVDLTITVRDCEAATRWRPVDRPFTISWRDEYGYEHLDRAGDFDRSMARSLNRYIDAACGSPLDR
jgi:hypothetical protein